MGTDSELVLQISDIRPLWQLRSEVAFLCLRSRFKALTIKAAEREKQIISMQAETKAVWSFRTQAP